MSMNDGSSRPRFMDTFKAALQPREPIKVDPDAPNPVPRTVTIAGWMTLVAAVVTAFVGALYIFGRETSIRSALDQIDNQINECNAQGIGIGSAVTTTDTSDLITLCKTVAVPTADQIASARSTLLMVGIVLVVIAVALGVGGYFLLRGTRWARRVVTVAGGLLLIGTMLQLFGSPLLLVSALILLIAMAMCYVGKGATYYIRAKAKGVR
jgi:uncharacterized membrane protein